MEEYFDLRKSGSEDMPWRLWVLHNNVTEGQQIMVPDGGVVFNCTIKKILPDPSKGSRKHWRILVLDVDDPNDKEEQLYVWLNDGVDDPDKWEWPGHRGPVFGPYRQVLMMNQGELQLFSGEGETHTQDCLWEVKPGYIYYDNWFYTNRYIFSKQSAEKLGLLKKVKKYNRTKSELTTDQRIKFDLLSDKGKEQLGIKDDKPKIKCEDCCFMRYVHHETLEHPHLVTCTAYKYADCKHLFPLRIDNPETQECHNPEGRLSALEFQLKIGI